MKLHKDIFIIIVIGYSLLLTSPSSTALSPQLPPLPADLVFGAYTTVIDPHDGLQRDHYALAFLDHETLEITELYHSDRLVHPLSWSPQGDLLTFLAIKTSDGWDQGEPMDLCVVTATGILQTCFEDPLTYFRDIRSYTATWSKDGTKVYFVTLEGQEWQLIEADALTGKRIRVIYATEYQEGEFTTRRRPTRWTTDLKVVGLEISYSRIPGFLVYLDTGKEIDIREILKPYIDETMEREHPESIYICPDFSPQNTYLAAFISTLYDDDDTARTNQLIIFDTTGNTVLALEEPDVLNSCPTWTQDESSFYFYRSHTGNRRLFLYSLSNNSLIEWGDPYGRGATPVAVSPDGTHIAFRAPYESALIVLYPDRVMRKVSAYYGPVMLGIPLWRPVVGDS